MTKNDLACSYLEKATKGKRVLDVLMEEAAYSDVIREAQELVELAMKAMLRWVGIDPPKWHDVGPIMLENVELFPDSLRPDLPQLAEISRWLQRRNGNFHSMAISTSFPRNNTRASTPSVRSWTRCSCSTGLAA